MVRFVPFALLFLASLTPALPAQAQGLSRAEIGAVAQAVAVRVDSHYVFPERAPTISGHLRDRLAAGSYASAAGPDSLAAVLTRDLRAASGDRHLYVQYLRGSAGEGDAFDWDAWAARERVEEQAKNFGFTEARVLDGNVGYLRIAEFMHPDRGYEAARSAMGFLQNTEAMVIDLRGNGGGYGGLMELVLSHYFGPAPTHVSTTYVSGGEPTKTFTLPFVPGRRREGEPLYVVVDGGTGSAAEFFAYTLQAFEKATVVGAPTAGAAHRNTYYDVGPPLAAGRFRVSVSTGAPVNPLTRANWEGSGVQPNVAHAPEAAVGAAHLLALRALHGGAEGERRERLGRIIEGAGGERE